LNVMGQQQDPPLTGKEFDFTTSYFGHDFTYRCRYPEGHQEPAIHDIVGWAKPAPEVGDVFIGRIHRADGDAELGKLLLIEVEHHPNPPDYFSGTVRELAE
jgi:hypothetical protein